MTIPLITGQLNPSQGDFNNLINSINNAITGISPLTGDVTSVGHVTTVAKIRGTTISGTTGTGNIAFSNSPSFTTPALDTPSALVGTNITGTASSFTAGHVTTNANLTGPITSVGNATSVAAQTGTGSTFVMNTSPTLITPILGVATATSVNKIALTAPATGATLTLADGKTLTANNNITLTGTDGVSMNVTNSKVRTIGFSVSSASLTTGQQGGYVVVPVSGTITGWSICANAGTATVTTWKIPNGTAVPTVSNSISTAGVALATGTAIESTTVSDFTSTTVTAGDIFAFNLSAVSGVTTLQFQLQITVA